MKILLRTYTGILNILWVLAIIFEMFWWFIPLLLFGISTNKCYKKIHKHICYIEDKFELF